MAPTRTTGGSVGKVQQKEAVMVSGFATKQTELKETMTEKESKSKNCGIKALMKEDEDLLRSLTVTSPLPLMTTPDIKLV